MYLCNGLHLILIRSGSTRPLTVHCSCSTSVGFTYWQWEDTFHIVLGLWVRFGCITAHSAHSFFSVCRESWNKPWTCFVTSLFLIHAFVDSSLDYYATHQIFNVNLQTHSCKCPTVLVAIVLSATTLNLVRINALLVLKGSSWCYTHTHTHTQSLTHTHVLNWDT